MNPYLILLLFISAFLIYIYIIYPSGWFGLIDLWYDIKKSRKKLKFRSIDPYGEENWED